VLPYELKLRVIPLVTQLSSQGLRLRHKSLPAIFHYWKGLQNNGKIPRLWRVKGLCY